MDCNTRRTNHWGRNSIHRSEEPENCTTLTTRSASAVTAMSRHHAHSSSSSATGSTHSRYPSQSCWCINLQLLLAPGSTYCMAARWPRVVKTVASDYWCVRPSAISLAAGTRTPSRQCCISLSSVPLKRALSLLAFSSEGDAVICLFIRSWCGMMPGWLCDFEHESYCFNA